MQKHVRLLNKFHKQCEKTWENNENLNKRNPPQTDILFDN